MMEEIEPFVSLNECGWHVRCPSLPFMLWQKLGELLCWSARRVVFVLIFSLRNFMYSTFSSQGHSVISPPAELQCLVTVWRVGQRSIKQCMIPWWFENTPSEYEEQHPLFSFVQQWYLKGVRIQNRWFISSKEPSTRKVSETPEPTCALGLLLIDPHESANDHLFLSSINFSVFHTQLYDLRILEQK